MKTMERVEKKQGKQRGGGREREKKKASWTEIPAGLLYTYTSSFPFPSDSEVDPLPTHTDVEIFKTHSTRKVLMGFQWQSNLAIFQSSLQALCFAEGRVGGWRRRGLLGQAQQRCITACMDPPRVWVGG